MLAVSLLRQHRAFHVSLKLYFNLFSAESLISNLSRLRSLILLVLLHKKEFRNAPSKIWISGLSLFYSVTTAGKKELVK